MGHGEAEAVGVTVRPCGVVGRHAGLGVRVPGVRGGRHGRVVVPVVGPSDSVTDGHMRVAVAGHARVTVLRAATVTALEPLTTAVVEAVTATAIEAVTATVLEAAPVAAVEAFAAPVPVVPAPVLEASALALEATVSVAVRHVCVPGVAGFGVLGARSRAALALVPPRLQPAGSPRARPRRPAGW